VQESQAELEKDRDGYSVDEITINNISNIKPNETVSEDVIVANETNTSCTFSVHELRYPPSGIKFPSGSVIIPPNSQHIVGLNFTPLFHGITRAVLKFQFNDTCITRRLTLRCANVDDEAFLKPTSPYVRPSRKSKGVDPFMNPELVIMPATGRAPFVYPVPVSPVPESWKDELAVEAAPDILEDLLSSGGGLSKENYSAVFQKLLWAEEVQMDRDIKNFDMTPADKFERLGSRRFKLHCKGLAESRPSVLKGDKILLSINGRSFEGYVERVQLEDAILMVPQNFNRMYVTNAQVSVRFRFKRLPLQTSHQAIKQSDSLDSSFLFPLPTGDSRRVFRPSRVSSVPDNSFYNPNLNAEQRQAVRRVVAEVCRPSPYLIYGPPGTGKTVTLVESILQTLKHKTGKVLICAPSNSACDLIVERLANFVSNTEMLRLVAFSREFSAVNANVRKFTRWSNEDDGFATPALGDLLSFRVIAVTLTTCGKLFNIGLANHFTHIFMDEAGHAIEPEALASFAKIAAPDPSVVLAGDPKQLGPIIRSPLATRFGLDKSLLERLCELPAYSRDESRAHDGENPYDANLVTKLVRNYRSHPSILKVPNALFYDNDLVATADPILSHCLQHWEHLPTPGFPCLFHGVEGEDQRESNSPSFFNATEASIVADYVDKLIKDTRRNALDPCDIGIVSPYAKQVQKIRLLLAKRDDAYTKIKVGSVDEFQGQERRVIIISTVRSSVEFLQMDEDFRLGFVKSVKRFNVAITRAQALVIVIGNPKILSLDDSWNAFLQHCKANGGCIGSQWESMGTAAGGEEAEEAMKAALGPLLASAEQDGEEEDYDLADDLDGDNEDWVAVSKREQVENVPWKSEE
jgi:helicase MOV-10